MSNAAPSINAVRSVCTCVLTWTYCAACVEKSLLCSQVGTYAPLRPHTRHCRLSGIQHAKVCACMRRVGATGQGQGHGRARVLVLSMRQSRVGQCTGQQRGCGVLHVPLMSFLGQARPRGELISKQATEELLQPSAAAAGSPADHSLSASLHCFLFVFVTCFFPSSTILTLCLALCLSFPCIGSTMMFDFSQRHRHLGQQVTQQTDWQQHCKYFNLL